MDKNLTLFTPLDIDLFTRSLGHKPTQLELRFLSKILNPVLHARDVLPIDAVKQLSDLNYQLFIQNLVIDQKSKLKGLKRLIRTCSMNGFIPEQIDFIFNCKITKKLLDSLNKNEFNHLTKIGIPYETHLTNSVPTAKHLELTAIATPPESYLFRTLMPQQKIYWIKLPRPSQSYRVERKIYQLLSDYAIISGLVFNNNEISIIQSLINQCGEKETGISIRFNKEMKKGDGIIVVTNEGERRVKRDLISLGFECSKIGDITNNLTHNVQSKKGVEKKWPISLFTIAIHNSTTHNISPISSNESISKKPKKLSDLNLIKQMVSELDIPNKQLTKFVNVEPKQPLILNYVDNGIYSSYPEAFHGIRFIADAVRSSVELGQQINNSLINYVRQDDKYIEGVHDAIKAFQLSRGARYNFNENLGSQNSITHIGKCATLKKSEDIGSGDFISLLGTFKGELNHSLYNQLKNIPSTDETPGFDSTMEFNIYQTILQGVSAGIIKKCIPISQGGLIIALLKLFRSINNEFGIKIHISRKLSDEEILYGESFGSELVIIGEKELMEFQRICMTHGIPCSTIGRIQVSGEISVNKIVNLKASYLKGVFSK